MTGKTHHAVFAFLAFALIVLCAPAFAAETQKVAEPLQNFSGDLSVRLNKTEFSAGETIRAEINLLNLDDSPLFDADVISEIVQGNGFYYPSQSSDVDNIFFEKKIGNISIAPHYAKKVSFEYAIPKDAAPGNYRMDVYLRNRRAPVVGIAHIFAAPKSVRFKVSGNGAFPQAKIVRTKTEFHHQPGPVGPGIAAGQKIESTVFVENASASEMRGLELRVGICDWDDTACDRFLEEKKIPVGSVAAGKTAEVNVSLAAPELPSAYAIRLELVDSGGRTQSIYRNRSVVLGPTAKIRKVSLNDYSFGENENVELEYLIGPSPDHYTLPRPVFENFSLRVSVKDERSGKEVFSGEQAFDKIAIPDFFTTKFPFDVKSKLDFFTVCSQIEKQSKVFDRYCFTINAEEFAAQEKKAKLAVSWNYDRPKSMLALEFSNGSNAASDINAFYFLLSETQNPESKGFVAGSSPQTVSFEAPPATYVLVVNDLSTRTQKSFEINLLEKAAAGTCAERNGMVCGKASYCSAKTAAASDSAECCLAQCLPRIETGKAETKTPSAGIVPVALAVAVLVALAGAAYLVWKSRKRNGGRADGFDEPAQGDDLEA
ncbi:MAG: hypothetical protein HY394_00305 [Candidatus Diapherotrites archaeon]|nr:hypothetical protein [Candidatus Diapherotrites archaeon]